MIDRYSLPEMSAIWSDQGRYERWLDVELAVVDVLAGRGVVPIEAARSIREKAGFDVARIRTPRDWLCAEGGWFAPRSAEDASQSSESF